MEEKKKRKKKQLIIRILLIVFTIIALIFLVLLFIPKQERSVALSEFAREITAELEQSPHNPETQLRFITGVIREQEQINQSSAKNWELITHAEELAQDYLQERDDDMVQLHLGRLKFQLSSIASDRGNLIVATQKVQEGIIIFDSLVEKYQDELVYRMYRAINYSNLPTMFGKSDTASKDFNDVANLVLATGFDPEQVFDDLYYLGTLVPCLERGIQFAKENGTDSQKLKDALKQLK